MERVTPVIDETIRTLAKTKFINDPVAGDRYSRATSIVTSALLICAIDKPRSCAATLSRYLNRRKRRSPPSFAGATFLMTYMSLWPNQKPSEKFKSSRSRTAAAAVSTNILICYCMDVEIRRKIKLF